MTSILPQPQPQPQPPRLAPRLRAGEPLYDVPATVDEDGAPTWADARRAERACGEREPFVLLSGMLGDASLWDRVNARLGEVVQPWPARVDLDDSVPEMAASVLAAAPPGFALGGHSLGAIVALEIMRQAPGRVSRLLLVNASPRGPSEAQHEAWELLRRRTIHGEFELVAAELAVATLAEPRRRDEEMVRANIQMARTVGVEGFLRQLSAQDTRPDSRRSLGSIQVPVLVVSGGLDEVCPPALQREILEGCPGAELLSVEDSGHMLPLECPDALADQLELWLRRS